ncbi:integrase, catalytic region, zinc finger, CCHC-type containing protein [Tanacetum coccineum]
MTGNLKLLCNFIEKYLGMVLFRNDQFALIFGYKDLVQGNVTIKRSLGNDLLTGTRGFDLYTISLQETSSPTPICFMAKASLTQAWLWHRILSHLNFDTINLLSKNDIVNGLPTSKLPFFFWAEAIATAYYTQNRSLIILRYEKTPYHIINDRKPTLKNLYIFGCICYLVRDGENLDKMKEKGDPCAFVGYSTTSKGYRVYNKRTKLIIESIHINFDEIKHMALDYDNSGPAPQLHKTSVHSITYFIIQDHNNEHSSSMLVPNVAPPTDKTDTSL